VCVFACACSIKKFVNLIKVTLALLKIYW